MTKVEAMLRTFIQVTAIFVTIIGSIFWIRGSMLLSVKDIAALAGTHWGYNQGALENLAAQKADALVAGILLLVSFVLQIWNAGWEMRWNDFKVNQKGIVVSILFSIFLFMVCNMVTSWLKNYYYHKAEDMLKRELGETRRDPD